MRSVDIAEATRALADYARRSNGETVVVTRRGRPVAAVVPIRGIDMETLALSTNADFVSMIEQSREGNRTGGGLTLEEMRERYAGASKVQARRRRVPRAAARPPRQPRAR